MLDLNVEEKNFIHWGQWRKSPIRSLYRSSNYCVSGIFKDAKPTQNFYDPNPTSPQSVKAEKKEQAPLPRPSRQFPCFH